jgi:adenine-specific DNA glycosylase
MSQQTQIDRVIPYRKKWIKDIPDYKALASLPKLDLLSYRSGL